MILHSIMTTQATCCTQCIDEVSIDGVSMLDYPNTQWLNNGKYIFVAFHINQFKYLWWNTCCKFGFTSYMIYTSFTFYIINYINEQVPYTQHSDIKTQALQVGFFLSDDNQGIITLWVREY